MLVPADKDSGAAAIVTPEGFHRDQFLSWASSLPDAQSPTWLGLPANAQMVLLTQRAAALASSMSMLQVCTCTRSSSLPN